MNQERIRAYRQLITELELGGSQIHDGLKGAAAQPDHLRLNKLRRRIRKAVSVANKMLDGIIHESPQLVLEPPQPGASPAPRKRPIPDEHSTRPKPSGAVVPFVRSFVERVRLRRENRDPSALELSSVGAVAVAGVDADASADVDAADFHPDDRPPPRPRPRV